MHGGEVQHCMRDRERWFSDSNRFAISLTRLFIGVSAFCVFAVSKLVQSKQIYCHNTATSVTECVCVCLSHARVHATCRYVWEKSGSVIDVSASPRLRQDPDGTLHISQTWSGDIGTYTCRVTSVGGNDSRSAHLRVRYAYLSLPSYLAAVFSLRIYVTPGRDGWMFSPLFVVYHHSPL